MNFIEKRIINNKIERHKELFDNQNAYTILESNYFKNLFSKIKDYKTLNEFVDSFISWDKEVTIPKETGKYLEDLVENKNLKIGIHRTRVYPDIYSDDVTRNILENGLRNYGDMNSGSIRKRPDLTKTMVLTLNLYNLLITIKNSYNGSTGAFIFAFPSDIIDDEGTITKENTDLIYNEKDNIKPEYLLGYLDNSYGVMNFITKENLIKEINKRNEETFETNNVK